MKNFRFDSVLSVILLIFSLMFIMTTTGYAGGNPPTGDEHLTGPAIVGQVIASPSPDAIGYINIVFMGNCKGNIPVDLEFPPPGVPGVLDDITKENLKYQRVAGGAALVDPECSRVAEGDLIINSVIRIEDIEGDSPVKIADVVVLFVTGKGN